MIVIFVRKAARYKIYKLKFSFAYLNTMIVNYNNDYDDIIHVVYF